MNREDTNRAVSNMRINYPKEYRELVKNIDGKIHPYLSKKLRESGFETYEQVKEAVPRGVKVGYFIIELLK